MTAESSVRQGQSSTSPLSEHYRPGRGYDEMIAPDGSLRQQWRPLTPTLGGLNTGEYDRIRDRVREMVDDDGVTYNRVTGTGSDAISVPVRWHLDAMPMVLDSDEWDSLARSMAQRSLLLDAVLRDFYGDQRSVREQIVPPEVIFANPGYIRKAVGVPAPGPKALFLHAADIGRAADGQFAVFADRTQAPSGVGYALAGRRITARSLPRMFRQTTPRSLVGFAHTLRSSLLEAAPLGVDDPTAVVLSPGSLSETAFDQAHLASVLGVPLVEASDLTVRDGGLYMRSLGRMKRVDIVLRRVDSEFSDPLDLRTDSRLGVVGLVELVTRGAVSVVNTLGSGVLEAPALHPYLPDLCRALLDEELLLPSTPTHPMTSPAGRAAVDRKLDDLLLTHTATRESVVGAELDAASADHLRSRIAAEPELWTAQELVEFSTAPSLDGAGPLAARGFGIRAFAVAQESGYAVMGGGLGHVLMDGRDGSQMVSTAARDVWVPTSEDTRASVRVAIVPAAARPAPEANEPVATPRVLSDLFWMGRYAERAEALVRVLSVASDRTSDYRNRPWQWGAESLQPWLDVVVAMSGVTPGPIRAEGADEADVLARLRDVTLTPTVPGTVAYSFGRLAAGARAVRDQMSTGTWTVLGGAERTLHRLEVSGDEDGGQLDITLGDLLVSLLAFSGLARESMVRDPGWLMMDAGRRIERSLQLAALTREAVVPVRDPDTDAAMIDSYLLACESSVTYRRRHRSVTLARPAVALMFVDETNPRSLIFLLSDLRDDLQSLPEAQRSGPVERVVEEQIAQVGRFDPDDTDVVEDGRRTKLAEFIVGIVAGLREISDVLERTRFATPTQTQSFRYGTVRRD